MRVAVLMAALALAACQTTPPEALAPVIACPQPSSEALSSPARLPPVAELPNDPTAAIGVLSGVIATDTATYNGEVSKRQALIDYGVSKCGWTR